MDMQLFILLALYLRQPYLFRCDLRLSGSIGRTILNAPTTGAGQSCGPTCEQARTKVLLVEKAAQVGDLCSCCNDMDSIMNGACPGPGITLGAALTFGYLAARHAAST